MHQRDDAGRRVPIGEIVSEISDWQNDLVADQFILIDRLLDALIAHVDPCPEVDQLILQAETLRNRIRTAAETHQNLTVTDIQDTIEYIETFRKQIESL